MPNKPEKRDSTPNLGFSNALINYSAIQNINAKPTNNDNFFKEKCMNIKTFIRFRPLNKTELEVSDVMAVDFPVDNRNVLIKNDNSVYTLDKVYSP